MPPAINLARHRARLISAAALVFNAFMKADLRISVKDNSRYLAANCIEPFDVPQQELPI
jgi:hypothetical protein